MSGDGADDLVYEDEVEEAIAETPAEGQKTDGKTFVDDPLPPYTPTSSHLFFFFFFC